MKQFYKHPAYYNGELAYVQVPRLIFDPPFEKMSNEARILYGMLLDRMELSYDNPTRWSDNGNAYVYFHLEEVQQTFGVAEEKATKVFKELEAAHFIQRKRQGFGRPARIYINDYWQDLQDVAPYQKTYQSPFNGPKRRIIGFIDVPWALFYEPYQDLSNGARILFGLMKKRMDWAWKNNTAKQDKEGAYIYYSVDEIMKILHIFKEKATKLLKELEAAKLIQRQRQGFGRPAKIRIILPPMAPAMETVRPHTPENRTSHTPENRTSHTPENRTSRIPENRTSTFNNYSFNNHPIYQSTHDEAASKTYTVPVDEGEPPRIVTKEEIAQQIGKERLHRECPQYTAYTDSVIELIYDEVTSDQPRGRVGQATRARADIRARLCSLTSEDVEGVIKRMNKLSKYPRNPRAYMLTSLYNAATTSTTKDTQNGYGQYSQYENGLTPEVAKYARALYEKEMDEEEE